jgi:hypothetical protein
MLIVLLVDKTTDDIAQFSQQLHMVIKHHHILMVNFKIFPAVQTTASSQISVGQEQLDQSHHLIHFVNSRLGDHWLPYMSTNQQNIILTETVPHLHHSLNWNVVPLILL